MKKVLKILVYIVLIIFLFIGILIALFMYSRYSSKKDLAERRIEMLEECNKDSYITQPLAIDLLHFKNSDIDTLYFEIIRNNNIVKDTTIIGTIYGEYTLSVDIPFKKFQVSDTIAMTTSNGLQFKISNFKRNVNELYGMFGPVALTDCYVVDKYTINTIVNTRKVVKYYATVASDSNQVQRVFTEHPDYKKLTASYPINQEKADSIGRMIYANYNKSYGAGSDYGLEITPQKSYYIKGFRLDDDEIEIIKIDTQTGAQSERLTNYPFENEF